MLFPLVVRAFGLIASIVGVDRASSRTDEDEDPMHALNRGFYVTAVLALGGFAAASTLAAQRALAAGCFVCGLVGIADQLAFVFITQYYTEYSLPAGARDRRGVATGPATNIISGIAVGLRVARRCRLSSSAWRCCSAPTSLHGSGRIESGIATAPGSSAPPSPRWACSRPPAYILAMDTFGPITDNAGGIVEMSQPAGSRPREDRQPRRRRQHDQGADQGLRHRLRRARRLPALLRLS